MVNAGMQGPQKTIHSCNDILACFLSPVFCCTACVARLIWQRYVLRIVEAKRTILLYCGQKYSCSQFGCEVSCSGTSYISHRLLFWFRVYPIYHGSFRAESVQSERKKHKAQADFFELVVSGYACELGYCTTASSRGSVSRLS